MRFRTTRRLLTVVLVAVGALAAAREPARADGWSMFRGDAALTGRAAGTLPDSPGVLWTHETDEGDGFEATAAIHDGVVYAGALDGKMRALSLDSGKLLWAYDTGTEIKSSPAVLDGVVYFGDEDGLFHAVSAADGKARWTFTTDAAVSSSPNFHADLVMFGSQDAFLYALSRKDGELRWKLETGSYIYATPALMQVGGTPAAVLAGCDGFVRAVRVTDGVEIGQVDIGGYVGASPAVAGEKAYFGTFENQFLAVDLGKGEVSWRYEHPERKFPYYSSAALTDDIVIVGGRDKMVHGLNPASGEELWSHTTRARVDSSPVIVGERAFIGSMAGEVLALDVKTGEAVWTYDTGAPVLASPAVAGGRLVIGNDDGILYCFGTPAGAAPKN